MKMGEIEKVTSKALVDGREIPIMALCMEIGGELDDRHRITDNTCHLSRQITWEAKRVISGILGGIDNPDCLRYQEEQLARILRHDRFFTGVCRELYGYDKNYYYRYYTSALQEYVEAYALLAFVKYGRLIRYEEVAKRFTISFKPDPRHKSEENSVTYKIPITKTDFYLGLADITGELVRACAAGVHDKSLRNFLFNSCTLVRAMYQCFSRLVLSPRIMHEKLNVMRASLCKLELVCYHSVLKVDRFSRVAFHAMRVVPFIVHEEDDSGYD